MKILLIAGHGGNPYDSGAVGCGLIEAVETRKMVDLVAPLLQKYGFTVCKYDKSKNAFYEVTRGRDVFLNGAAYVVEFHLNSAANDPNGNGKTTGSEIWVHTNEKTIGAEQAILKRLENLGFRNRGVKRSSGLAVLKNVHRQGVSHALIETCFIDDKDDVNLYNAKKQAVAQAIADGIAEGFGKTVQPAQTTKKTEEEKPMTREQFEKFYDLVNPMYKNLDQVPAYWKQEVKEMIQRGAIKGDGVNEIGMREEALKAAIVAYRAAVAIHKEG